MTDDCAEIIVLFTPPQMYKPKSVLLLTLLILLGLGFLLLFLYGFITVVDVGHPVLYSLLTISLGYKLLRLLFEWYHYAGIRLHKPSPAVIQKTWKVDMLTTACPGEPMEMIEDTLKAMVGVRYPHENYLCDEGDDPALKSLCKHLGVHHVTRTNRLHAKAGNINNALQQARGEICVILDPDHAPTPDFLDTVLPHFEQPQVGYVQVVQAYKNQKESLVARGAAEQTYNFYGPYMNAMGQYGSAQAIGANCSFRREALESIGGHAPGLTEDMHTSMLLHAKGWKSVYVPKIVSRGLVPSSLSAYYKQQLKWSRGTFDLWFHVFPRLFRQFSWRQKLHYGFLPLYYLVGFITLIDIAVPVYSLITGDYPWHMDPLVFFSFYTPLLLIGLYIRLFAQKWLNEPQERGLHLFGGILRVGTWWIYLTGFMYTLFNIRVPYIPTPKEHDTRNEFFLALPNLLLALLSIAAVIYGLKQDWQPYSFLMAGFALFNALILFLAFAIGQTQWFAVLHQLDKAFKMPQLSLKWKVFLKPLKKVSLQYYLLLSPISLPLFAMPWLLTSQKEEIRMDSDQGTALATELGGFYTGLFFPSSDTPLQQQLTQAEKDLRHSFSILATALPWSDAPLPKKEWQSLTSMGVIPMIYWEPVSHQFAAYADHPDLSRNRKIFKHITRGSFDRYIDSVALVLRALNYPVYLNFAPEMDDPARLWSSQGENTAAEFVAAWRYIHHRFQALGVQNVTWVWSPRNSTAFETHFPNGAHYPENRYVDWIALTSSSDPLSTLSFEKHYPLFRHKLQRHAIDLPVLINLTVQPNAALVNKEGAAAALRGIKKEFPEIKAAIVHYSALKSTADKILQPHADSSGKYAHKEELTAALNAFLTPPRLAYKSAPVVPAKRLHSSIQGTRGSYSLLVEGEPFYMKGVCYNPQHDWRDGFLPLTRKQLEKDFAQIRAMGANTIRRYEPGIYDVNMFNVAEEQGLHILYGFWFDPAIDYYQDSLAKARYEAKVLKLVKKYKDQKAILAWNIGNETWGLQKKHFAKPYLTLTRRAYLEFLEGLAQKIREIDPNRPIFASEEHEHYQLASTVYELYTHLPSVDVIGINSYYKENIEVLQETFHQFDSLRPYVVTEFGPKGYWSHEFGDYRDAQLIEVSSQNKARWYKEQWQTYIEPNKGYNLGGFAFSWRDRYEGTATWFGITDYKGRLKPAYYSLQEAYTSPTNTHALKFPALTITGSWYGIAPGESLWVTASTTNDYKGSLTYEWQVQEESSWQDVSSIKNEIEHYKYVELKIPQKKASYRIYVHATDSAGNVVTASRPVVLK